MASPKKDSRLITVDGVVYRWRVRRRPAGPAPIAFAVQRADRLGAVLIATLPGTEPAVWAGTRTGPVVRSIVAETIRRGRERGWRPDQPGAAFPIDMDAEIWAHR